MLAFSLLLNASGTDAHAQEGNEIFVFQDALEGWQAETGVVMTNASQTLVLQSVAIEVSSKAIAAGVDPVDAARWSQAYVETGFVEISEKALMSKGLLGEVYLPFEGGTASAKVNTDFTPISLAFGLRKMPRIKLSVEPVPPRDYLVHINGESVEVTDRGEYGVTPGVTKLRVTRTGKSDCLWEGELASGDEQPVLCKM